ncbi:MAG: N-acetylmuramoyl-L-alanine amidase family protein [Bacillota bacterium]
MWAYLFTWRRLSWLMLFPLLVLAWYAVKLFAPGVLGVWGGVRCVVLDPGHGGEDPGAVGRRGTLEKDVVLATSLKLAELLRRQGIRVVLTRTTDVELGVEGPHGWKVGDLQARVAIANSSGADVFLSIHANADVYTSCRGAQVFYRADGNKDSQRLARTIQSEIKRLLKNTDREVSTNINQYVLKSVKMPAATVELGFLSNPEEETLLANPDYQDRLAHAICVGLLRYFQEASVPK